MKTLTKNNNKAGFFIGMTCPACAGELELDDDFFVLNCRHCGSVHRIKMPDIPPAFLAPLKTSNREAKFAIDRFLKKKGLPLTDSAMQVKKIYYPYWKIDAVLFRFRKSMYRDVYYDENTNTEEVVSERENTDVNLSKYTTTIAAGCKFEGVPDSLGMRTDYIKLMPFSKENSEDDFYSYPVVKSWDDIRVNLCANLASIGCFDENQFGENKTRLFNPKAALIYFPFYVFESYNESGFNRFAVDGVTCRVLDHLTKLSSETITSSSFDPFIKFGSITVSEHRCSNCGEDLPPKQSYIYVCRNCQSLQVLDSGNYPLNQIFRVEAESKKNQEFFPFWSLKMNDRDKIRLRSIFGGMYASDRVVIPAFKVSNLDAMFRLSKRFSAAIPKMNLVLLNDTDPAFHDVNICVNEAIVQADIFIYRDKFGRGIIDAEDENDPFQPVEISLFYAPFYPQNYFYVDSIIDAITFEKRVLK